MPAHTAKPILGIIEIRLPTMNDAVPVAATGGFDVLADAMGLVDEIVIKPQAGQTGGGHVAITNLFRREGIFYRQGRELWSGSFIRLAWAKRIYRRLGEQCIDGRAVKLWSSH